MISILIICALKSILLNGKSTELTKYPSKVKMTMSKKETYLYICYVYIIIIESAFIKDQ